MSNLNFIIKFEFSAKVAFFLIKSKKFLTPPPKHQPVETAFTLQNTAVLNQLKNKLNFLDQNLPFHMVAYGRGEKSLGEATSLPTPGVSPMQLK
ncbi:MAG: hypothetical protein HDR79_00690 [Bacteroides sp.]|nr:hypothetical protein [Bacteroides sp.]MBD5363449.1 hypothetical protein [Bacteroides sp.]MBD5371841.1 hypothetical protein [Bacteroides sp.]